MDINDRGRILAFPLLTVKYRTILLEWGIVDHG